MVQTFFFFGAGKVGKKKSYKYHINLHYKNEYKHKIFIFVV